MAELNPQPPGPPDAYSARLLDELLPPSPADVEKLRRNVQESIEKADKLIKELDEKQAKEKR